MTHQFHSTVLREYDIRGIIGETLGPDDARAIVAAKARQLFPDADPPGALVDLVDQAVLVGGLDFWQHPQGSRVIPERPLR
mgnify:CR=1 FL=1